MVATEIGLLDHRYAPFGSSARYRLAMLMYPWQVLRGVELRADTFRLWAREHRTRWSFRLHHPHFEAATESPDLGQALCDLARVCAVMAEPFGVPAGRVSSEVPGAHPGRAAPDSRGQRDRSARCHPAAPRAGTDDRPTATPRTTRATRRSPSPPMTAIRPRRPWRSARTKRSSSSPTRSARRSPPAPTTRPDATPARHTMSIASPKLKNR